MPTAIPTFDPALLKERRGTISRPKLAEMAGISFYTVKTIEQGKHKPSVHTLAALAQTLGCTVDDFLRRAA